MARSHSTELGNFWVDVTRGTLRILVPIAFVAALVLVANGAVQNFTDRSITTLSGQHQVIPGGPVASQEAIKELGTNGGGFFNANSAHPFENPNAITNLLEIFLLLLIPICLTRTLGTMLARRRQGLTVLLARVRAAIRRSAAADAPLVVEAGELRLNVTERNASRAGIPIHLTPTEWQIVEVLARRRGRLVRQRELLHSVWGPAYGRETNYLRVYLAQLRHKLEADPSRPRIFVTEPGIGYRFNA